MVAGQVLQLPAANVRVNVAAVLQSHEPLSAYCDAVPNFKDHPLIRSGSNVHR
jgi:hypothetical protein